MMGSVKLQTDPNPIIDEGAPSSTGGIINAVTLCDFLGIPLTIFAPREHYEHGWGDDCHDARPIVATWTLTIMDQKSNPVALTFDLVRGESPLLIGLDVMQHADIINTKIPRHIRFQRPFDTRSFSLLTYIEYDHEHSNTKRLRLEIIPHKQSSVATLMANISTLRGRTPLAFSKQIHRYTHAPAEEIKSICKTAGILDSQLAHAIDVVDSECEVCTKNGRLASTLKVSLTYVNAAFNQEVQTDFMHCTMKNVKYTLINMTDRGTGWSETRIVPNQSVLTMQRNVEQFWICLHGAPQAFSADDAYDKPGFHTFLRQYSIVYKSRPSRRHNKLGTVERKNGTIKAIIGKLDSDITDADAETVVARAEFLSTLFSGSRKLSSFQLAKGYSPSILGIPSSRVTPELLNAHKEQAATRALQTLLNSRNNGTLPSQILKNRDPIWVYYDTSSKAKKNEWVKATVIETQQHRVLARRSTKDPPMRIAYEDVRVAPKSHLTQELMSCSLEDELATDDDCEHQVNTIIPEATSGNWVSSDRGENEEGPPHEVSDSRISPTLLADSQPPQAENPAADINKLKVTRRLPKNVTLTSDRARVMKRIYKTIGKDQVSRKRLESAPSWIVREAFEKEHSSNWWDAYEEVDEAEVPRDANVISSHVVYKVKSNEDGS